jgi:CRP-like cAMP-binding protein
VAGFAAVTLAEWVLGTTVAVHAYGAGSALAVGLIGFRFAPAAIAGLWTTKLADHAQRHRILTLTAAGRAGVTALAAAALALHVPLGIVIGLVWLDAAIGSAYRPAQAALLPALVRTPGELSGHRAGLERQDLRPALPVVVLLGRGSFGRVDARAVARQDILELLRGVPFFAPLSLDRLEGVAARPDTQHRLACAEIVRQGDVDGRHWFLVDSGRVAVEVDGFVVGELRRGDQFGERALLRGAPRAATVRALTDVVLHALKREDFLAAISGVELHAPDLSSSTPERIDPWTALAQAPLVHSLGPGAVGKLIPASRVQEVDAGAPIVTAGERDDSYHVLLSGRAHVHVDGALRQELCPGDAFGEIAVLHRVPRTASVIASERSAILTVDGEAVRGAVRDHGDGSLVQLAG